MRMYTGGATQLEGGVNWSLAGRTFELLLLAPGPVTFNAGDANVTAVLAHGRNTEASGNVREQVTVKTAVSDFGMRFHTYEVLPTLYHPIIRRHSGAAVIYEKAGNDANSYPVGMIFGTQLKALLVSGGLRIPIPLHVESISNRVKSLEDSAILQHGTVEITADTAKFKTTTPIYLRSRGIQFGPHNAEDNLEFSAVHTVNTAAGEPLVWGAILLQIDEAGAKTTKIGPTTQTADQAFATEAEALAALPAPDAGKLAYGAITVQSKASTEWVANTSDLATTVPTQAKFYDYGPNPPT